MVHDIGKVLVKSGKERPEMRAQARVPRAPLMSRHSEADL